MNAEVTRRERQRAAIDGLPDGRQQRVAEQPATPPPMTMRDGLKKLTIAATD